MPKVLAVVFSLHSLGRTDPCLESVLAQDYLDELEIHVVGEVAPGPQQLPVRPEGRRVVDEGLTDHPLEAVNRILDGARSGDLVLIVTPGRVLHPGFVTGAAAVLGSAGARTGVQPSTSVAVYTCDEAGGHQAAWPKRRPSASRQGAAAIADYLRYDADRSLTLLSRVDDLRGLGPLTASLPVEAALWELQLRFLTAGRIECPDELWNRESRRRYVEPEDAFRTSLIEAGVGVHFPEHRTDGAAPADEYWHSLGAHLIAGDDRAMASIGALLIQANRDARTEQAGRDAVADLGRRVDEVLRLLYERTTPFSIVGRGVMFVRDLPGKVRLHGGRALREAYQKRPI